MLCHYCDKDTKIIFYTYYNILKNMTLKQTYESPLGHKVILEHAGYSPFDVPHRHHDPLWDREHFYDSWDNYMPGKEADRTYLVHGHTPMQFLVFQYGYKDVPPITKELIDIKYKWLYGNDEESKTAFDPFVLRYCNGHKFDIDLCTIVHNKAALLDLDTFEVIYFQEDEPKKE